MFAKIGCKLAGCPTNINTRIFIARLPGFGSVDHMLGSFPAFLLFASQKACWPTIRRKSNIFQGLDEQFFLLERISPRCIQ